jgi:hypothetical protein
MAIELLLSAVVIVLLGGMILVEWMSTPNPKYLKPSGWRATAERADLLLAACIAFCLVVVWLPFLLR